MEAIETCRIKWEARRLLDKPHSNPYNSVVHNSGYSADGSALGSGPRGRGFDSRYSDQKNTMVLLRNRRAFFNVSIRSFGFRMSLSLMQISNFVTIFKSLLTFTLRKKL